MCPCNKKKRTIFSAIKDLGFRFSLYFGFMALALLARLALFGRVSAGVAAIGLYCCLALCGGSETVEGWQYG